MALTGELGADALAIFKLPFNLAAEAGMASTDSLLFKPCTATIFFPLAKLFPAADKATGVAVEPDEVGVIITKVGPLDDADLDADDCSA